MFIAIENRTEMDASYAGCSTFCSTVGQKPSKAPYYVDDVEDVIMLLQALAQFDVCHIRWYVDIVWADKNIKLMTWQMLLNIH